MADGWIKLYWKTKDSLAGSNLIALGLWSHILLSTAHRDTLLSNGQTLHAGECIISSRELANGCNISDRTLRRYVDSFVQAGMVSVLKRDRNGTHLSVCKWAAYQTSGETAVQEQPRKRSESAAKRRSNGAQTESPKSPKSPDTRSAARILPTLEQVRSYCKERSNSVDPEQFFDHYEANGWVQGRGGKPVKDWKACVRTQRFSNFEIGFERQRRHEL